MKNIKTKCVRALPYHLKNINSSSNFPRPTPPFLSIDTTLEFLDTGLELLESSSPLRQGRPSFLSTELYIDCRSIYHELGGIMCYFELITFRCRHQVHRRFSHCHFARNDPFHDCVGVKQLKRKWYQADADCDDCIQQRVEAQQQQQEQAQQAQQEYFQPRQ